MVMSAHTTGHAAMHTAAGVRGTVHTAGMAAAHSSVSCYYNKVRLSEKFFHKIHGGHELKVKGFDVFQ